MKSGWRIILTIVAVVALLGGISAGVGLLTGASPERIFQGLNEGYHFNAYVTAYTAYFKQLFQYFAGLI